MRCATFVKYGSLRGPFLGRRCSTFFFDNGTFLFWNMLVIMNRMNAHFDRFFMLFFDIIDVSKTSDILMHFFFGFNFQSHGMFLEFSNIIMEKYFFHKLRKKIVIFSLIFMCMFIF